MQSPLSPAAPPLLLLPATAARAPVVFVSAHSGRDYPAAFLRASRLDPLTLRRSEDGFVDELFAVAPAYGAPLLAATFPRAFCDANREAWELDPTMFAERLPPWVNTDSPRVGAGLGTIARVVSSGERIYRTKLRFAEAEQRVHGCWEPFHAQLQALLDETMRLFGRCLLIDCHSMPAMFALPARVADFVLGDVYGSSCAAGVTQQVEAGLSGMGYRVRRNDPYAGGYITRHYGKPQRGIHALQVEISRALYMDETSMERLDTFASVRDDIEHLIAAAVTIMI